jgi:hypothetical protein
MLQPLFAWLKWLLWLYHSMGVGRKILNNGGKVLMQVASGKWQSLTCT